MLVISRRCDEEIVFPAIGVTVKLLRAAGNRARIGINAPSNIEILRKEVLEQNPQTASNHQLRNELNSLTLSMELYNRQVQQGQEDQAHLTYLQMLSRLKQIDASYSAPEGSNRSTTAPRVLVVDDDNNERELLAGLLRMDGCQVDTAANGGAALERLSEGVRPDVVLLDMAMPLVSGPETLSTIREAPALWDLKVFGVSGSRPEEVGVDVGGRRGVDDWFQKPLNPSTLMAAIRKQVVTPGSERTAEIGNSTRGRAASESRKSATRA